MPHQRGSPRMLARPVPGEHGGDERPRPCAGRRARFADSRFEPRPPHDVTCSASAGRSVSSSKNVSLRPNRKHLALVGARGARRGGGTGTTHFPYEPFRPLTKSHPSVARHLTSLGNTLRSPQSSPSCQKQPPPRQSLGCQEQGAVKGRDEQKSKTPTHAHSQTPHNSDFLH